jgi:hypothetical protein
MWNCGSVSESGASRLVEAPLFGPVVKKVEYYTFFLKALPKTTLKPPAARWAIRCYEVVDGLYPHVYMLPCVRSTRRSRPLASLPTCRLGSPHLEVVTRRSLMSNVGSSDQAVGGDICLRI